jgi:structural maintenance of chromosome 1
MGRLHRLELENFKSYFGLQIIGPFENFSAIVGPNGSGKSNMMDAISFVLGVQSRHLRSSHLKELIFRQDAHSAPARRASVKLVYIVSEDEVEGKDKGTEIHFSRTISASGVSNYKLDSKDVTYEVYENLLQNIGVLVKARNFLVFQGDVESVASKSPLELTKLLEQISGSDQLKNEYEELLKKKDEAEETTIFSMQKKKMYVTQKKEVKEQKDEAELFQQRQDELDNLKTEHVLWQIWRVKMAIEGHQGCVEGYDKDLITARDKEIALDAAILEGKKELASVSKLLTSSEKESSTRIKQLDSAVLGLKETRAKLSSLRKRIADLKRSEDKIQKDKNDQEENIEGLRSDMAALEQAEEELRYNQL